jgi:hypothetical protein
MQSGRGPGAAPPRLVLLSLIYLLLVSDGRAQEISAYALQERVYPKSIPRAPASTAARGGNEAVSSRSDQTEQ